MSSPPCAICATSPPPGYSLRPCSKCHRRICDPCADPYTAAQPFACREKPACAEALEKLDLYRLEFRLEGLPSSNASGRHFRSINKERRAWHKAVYWTARLKRPPFPLPLVRAVYTRHTSVPIDPTNLAESFKAIEDGLVLAGIMTDDKAANYTGGEPAYRREVAPRGRGFVTIEIEEGVADGEEEGSEYHLN